MSRLTDRLERDLREIAAGADPSPSAWASIVARLDEDAGPEVVVVPALGAKVARRRLWSAVAAAAAVVVAGSIALFTAIDDDQAVSIADAPDLTTYVSERNGFSVGYIDRGEATVTPALDAFGADLDGFDLIDTGSAAIFGGASTDRLLESNALCFNDANEPITCPSRDEQIDQALADLPRACGVPRSRQEAITIDGQAGRVAECTNRIEATVVDGGRLYVFTLSHERDDARAVFDAFLATIVLIPETAVDFPTLPDTFVSPTYGYSSGYVRQLTVATERWDPANQPVADVDRDPRVDAVETGFGAYLEGASTPVPDVVSIDDWVDQYVTPSEAGGCGVPRSQQEDILIDGQSGRVAECQDQVEATVVAGGRLYLFTLYRSSRDARAMFDAWMATIDLTPETAAP